MVGMRWLYPLFIFLWMTLTFNNVVALDNSTDSLDYVYGEGLDSFTTVDNNNTSFKTTEKNILINITDTLYVEELDNFTSVENIDESFNTTEVSTLDDATGISDVTYLEELGNKTLDYAYNIPEEDEENECDWSINSTGNDLNVTWSGNANEESEVLVSATMMPKEDDCIFQDITGKAKFSYSFIDLKACPNTFYEVSITFKCSTNDSNRQIWSAPGPPEKLSVLDVKNSSFQVTWIKPPGPGEIILYNISVVSSQGNFNKILNSDTEKITVQNLQPFTRYDVKVTAKNTDFWGNYSGKYYVVTNVGVPNTPRNLVAKSSTDTSVSLKWEEPTPSTGPILSYRIQWKHLNAIGEEDTKSNNTFYTISKLEPYVEYSFKVSAVTEAGQGTWSNETSRQTDIGVPHVPTNLQTSNVTDTSIGLKWNPPKPSTGPILSYSIHWKNSTKFSEVNLNTNDTFYTVEHLLPYQDYTFKVRAMTKAGQGEWSETLTAKTDIGIPYAPRNLEANSVRSTSLVLKWEEPSPYTGPILNYKLYWKNSSTSNELILDTNETSHAMTQLAPFVEYTFKVLAITKAGEGKWSEKLDVKTDIGVPFAPRNLEAGSVKNTSLVLKWQEPSPYTGPILHYKLFWKNSSASDELNLPTNATSYTMTQLAPFVEYTFKVLAFTKAGAGKWSEKLDVKTDIGVPFAPRNLEAVSVKNTSLVLKWEEPTPYTGPILYYKLLWKNSSDSNELKLSTNKTYHMMTQLAPFVEYKFRVIALTKAGAGKWSKTCHVKTDIGVPFAPRNLEAVAVKNTSLFLKWEEPTPYTGPILYYKLLWKNSSDSNELKLSTNKTYMMTQLAPFVEYKFRVVALTKAGAGKWSETCHVKTDIGVPYAPTALRTTEKTNTSISIKWNEPAIETGPIVRYRVFLSDSSSSWERDTASNSTSYKVEQLTPYVNYTLKVLGLTRAGPGEWSKEMLVETAIGTPHAPKDVTVSNIKNTSVEINWNKPLVSTGPIIHYRVHWRNSSGIYEIDTKSNTQTYKLDKMAPYCNYTIKVVAVTDAGRGRWSEEVIFRTDIGVPHSPMSLTVSELKNTSIALQWNRPKISTGPIQGYRVHWKNYGKEGEVNTGSTNTFYTLKQLTPYVDYTMKVLALTAAGPGEWSDELKVRTRVGVPHAPQRLTVTNLGNTSIDMQWEEPAVSTGKILKYRIHWQNSSGYGEEDTDQNDTLYRLKKLAPYVNYTVKILALTEAGPGEWSSELRVKTKIGVPYPPINLKYTEVTNTSVLLTWMEPKPITGPVLSYTVRWSSPLNSGTKSIKPAQLTHNLTDLLPYDSYTFDIAASTSAGEGDRSKSIMVQTDIGVPTAARHLSTEHTTNVSLFIKWDQPVFPNSPQIYYKLTWRPSSRKDINGSEIIFQSSSETETIRHVIPELYPYTNYSIRVYAITKAGQGPVSDELIAQTAVGVPLPAKVLSAKSINNRKALVHWMTEGIYPGPVEYSLQVWKVPGPCSTRIGDYVSKDLKGTRSFEEWNSDYKTEVTFLSPFGTYYFRILLKTSATDGIISPQSINIIIPSEAPSEPLDVTTTCFGSSTKLRLSWKRPAKPNGMISSYQINYGIGNLNSLKKVPVLNMCHDQQYTLSGLRPEKRYSIAISAKVANVKENGKSAEPRDICVLPAGIPFLRNTSHLLAKGSGHDALAIEWTKDTFSDYMGAIIEYAILVGKVKSLGNATNGKFADIYPPWVNFSNGFSEFYQATPPGWNPFNNDSDPLDCKIYKTFLRCFIGIEKDCEDGEIYCNGPLLPDTQYELKIQAFTRGGFTETNPIFAQSGPAPKSSNVGTVITIVMVLLFLAFIATGTYVMKKKGYFSIILAKRNKTRVNRNQKEDCQQEEPGIQMEECSLTTIFRFIKTKDFAEHVKIMMSDSHLQFSQEFEKLKNESPQMPCSIAEAEENRSKNRWINIFPFDHSRVKLLPLCDEPSSDFINANYVPGFSTKREYIATQGPLPHTVEDFWRMVWEQSVNMIVMLTQCIERGKKKCEKYWPDSGETEYYGDLKISTVSESMLSSFIIRIFRVQLGSYERNIKQMHFTHWPDFGCPESPQDLINFVNAVRDHLPRSKPGPIIVHCSAGVGRTGTFISVDSLSLQLRNATNPGEDTVDIYGTVLELRKYRTNMVQTEDQYIYIHLCVRQLIQERDRLQLAQSEENIYSNI